MKNNPIFREMSALAAAAFASAAVFAMAPLARGQQTPPPPNPAAAPASSSEQSDIFDAIKKGADKLQREARKTRDIEPEIRQLLERQEELSRRLAETDKAIEARDKELVRQLGESKRELVAALAKQQEMLDQIVHVVEKIDSEPKPHHAPIQRTPPLPPVTPAPTAPLKPADADNGKAGEALPVTEPPTKSTPASGPASQP